MSEKACVIAGGVILLGLFHLPVLLGLPVDQWPRAILIIALFWAILFGAWEGITRLLYPQVRTPPHVDPERRDGVE